MSIKITNFFKLTASSFSYYIWRFFQSNEIKKRYFNVNGINLYYESIGSEGGIPLIFLHGGSAFIDSFMGQLPFFASKKRCKSNSTYYHIIAVESRGHGRSTDSEARFSYSLMADDVLSLLNYLKIDKASIIGWSDGGIIGLDLAIRYPDRIHKLVLVGTNFNLTGLVPAFQEELKYASAKNWIEPSAVWMYKWKSRYKKPKPDPDIFIKKIAKMWLTEPNYSEEQIKTIKCPTLVMTGQNEEYIFESHTRQLAQLLQNAQLELIPNSGHECLMEQRKLCNSIIDEYLRRN